MAGHLVASFELLHIADVGPGAPEPDGTPTHVYRLWMSYETVAGEAGCGQIDYAMTDQQLARFKERYR